MDETPEGPRPWQAPDGWHHSPQEAFGGPPPSPTQPDRPKKRTWIVVVVVVVVLAILMLAALAVLALLGVRNIRQQASTPERVVSTLPTPSTALSGAVGATITCDTPTPESVALITKVLAPPAESLAEARSYTNGRYEVFVASLLNKNNQSLDIAMWMIARGTPYAASSGATAYSSGIEDLTYRVNLAFQGDTGLWLKQVADVLQRPCPAD